MSKLDNADKFLFICAGFILIFFFALCCSRIQAKYKTGVEIRKEHKQ